jgi:hypothetical protein
MKAGFSEEPMKGGILERQIGVEQEVAGYEDRIHHKAHKEHGESFQPHFVANLVVNFCRT